MEDLKDIIPTSDKVMTSDYRQLAHQFVIDSLNLVKNQYKDYEINKLFDEIDIVRDSAIAQSELKFFLVKQQWLCTSPFKIKKRDEAMQQQREREQEWFRTHHPKMAESWVNIRNHTSAVEQGQVIIDPELNQQKIIWRKVKKHRNNKENQNEEIVNDDEIDQL